MRWAIVLAALCLCLIGAAPLSCQIGGDGQDTMQYVSGGVWNGHDFVFVLALDNGGKVVNDALIDFRGTVLFISHDHQFVDSIANRIVELTPAGFIDRSRRFDDYLASAAVRELRDRHYHGHHLLEI